ncbi:MAG: rhodanese-like domain-containing protein [Hyphomicrobium sp.]|nr:rhodanese-like domain-containing protein [Hyphomicrobium sp.]
MLLTLALAFSGPHADGTELMQGIEFDPGTGYRIARYRAALPEDAPGASRIFAPDVEALVKDKKAILLDVMASDGAGSDPVTGQWRLSKTHDHIPGSTWLPDVGKGRLDARLEAYFRSNLERLTGGDRSRAIIIYCQSDCWMSWNAVKRAAALGYTSLYWFPEGTDGWRDWDGRLVPAIPVRVVP